MLQLLPYVLTFLLFQVEGGLGGVHDAVTMKPTDDILLLMEMRHFIVNLARLCMCVVWMEQMNYELLVEPITYLTVNCGLQMCCKQPYVYRGLTPLYENHLLLASIFNLNLKI